jgi:DNA-binding NarL/FixJ family response regulator
MLNSSMACFETSLTPIVLIDDRCLERECFARSVESINDNIKVIAIPSAGDWIEQVGKAETPAAILYSTLGRRIGEQNVAEEIAALEKASRPVPVIVLSTFEDLSEMIAALDCGARGYIPASLGIEATLTAVRLSIEGAVFMTAASVMAMRSALETQSTPGSLAVQPAAGMEGDGFTARQAAVADRLRRGKPNKLIAYELNMCESTVKVHIRNIMKKLRASNRTEAGYKLNAMISDAERSAALGGTGRITSDPA